HSTKGETPTLQDIADTLEEESWVDVAIPEELEENATSGYIYVRVNEGYVYQVYYDWVRGKVRVDYLGKEEEGKPPIIDSELTLKARYIKSTAKIEAEAKDEINGVAKLELIYKDKIIEDMTIQNPRAKEEWEVSGIGTGEYAIKATSNSGAVRYRIIYVDNVSDKLKPPVIILNPAETNGENDWYKTEVQVTMETDSPSAKEIRYMVIENGISNTPEEGIKYEGTITIKTNGTVTIKAWTTDGTYKSDPDKCEETFFLDNTKPSLVYPPTIIARKPPVNNWYKSELEIEISGKDEHSKIAGYRYQIEGESTKWIDKKINQKIGIGANEREGVTKVAVKTFDNAGNESEVKVVTIQKDTVAPDTAKIEFKTNTANSITVSAYRK
ncbi:MAG: hypothetical protein HFJ50_10275, partial [Clostridia bacterium]|nr:hypothetical protein [Clostridia bacterium]